MRLKIRFSLGTSTAQQCATMTPGELTSPSRLRVFAHTQINTPWWVQKLLGRAFAPTAAEYSQLQSGLFEGDPVMDAYVQARLAESPGKSDWREFHQAFNAPDPQTLEGSDALHHLLRQATALPAWVDTTLINEGVDFIHSTGRTATDVLRDMALMGGYLMVAFNKTLILTGELEKGAAPRLAGTAQWWLKVVSHQANLPGNPGLHATLRVRWVHALVRHQLKNNEQWDSQQWGLPINQVDMAATYLGFSAVMLLGLRKCGIVVTPRNSLAVMQLWKLIGWQMGVKEEWLVDTEQQALVRLRQFLFTHSPPDESTHRLAAALAGEPLSRTYPRLETIRQRFAYLKHLSSSWYLLGPGLFRKLGLHSPTGPLLALLYVPAQAVVHLALRSTGPSAQLQIRWGRQAQELAVAELQQKTFPERKPTISTNAN
ncbi:uncharacterized protein DUF2236 [Limnobacter thiooxidans]|uniref:Oxygenase MpaB family protein n=1 Tax=Limnobacter thiooxidans TaxID=131080 RepID=A0AA86MB10_9BURK|nr:uncharacterized protein DUF2236 [Limnobacter thiooxidans]BET25663.1 oxygenase MpaB family protein [Limnobacter thiooxidans]